jgi:succinate-semialdehyde dehydrogenase/glutarate-semialdehyde dehydrogenase
MIPDTLRSQLANPGLLRDKAYINGSWVDGLDKVFFDVTNPATGEVLAQLPDIPRSQVVEAVVSNLKLDRSKTDFK